MNMFDVGVWIFFHSLHARRWHRVGVLGEVDDHGRTKWNRAGDTVDMMKCPIRKIVAVVAIAVVVVVAGYFFRHFEFLHL